MGMYCRKVVLEQDLRQYQLCSDENLSLHKWWHFHKCIYSKLLTLTKAGFFLLDDHSKDPSVLKLKRFASMVHIYCDVNRGFTHSLEFSSRTVLFMLHSRTEWVYCLVGRWTKEEYVLRRSERGVNANMAWCGGESLDPHNDVFCSLGRIGTRQMCLFLPGFLELSAAFCYFSGMSFSRFSHLFLKALKKNKNNQRRVWRPQWCKSQRTNPTPQPRFASGTTALALNREFAPLENTVLLLETFTASEPLISC